MGNGKNIIPVQVLTGFLGAGKTTFLNAVLKHALFEETAVIINEFGDTSLDHFLVESSDDQVIELANGCICCTVRGQLIDTLQMVVEKSPKRIIIETTGLADPLPILQAIIHSPALMGKVEFAGMITIIDALQGSVILENHEEAQKQVALSDLICISKLDQCDEPPRALNSAIHSLNPTIQIIEKQRLLVDLKCLLNLTSNIEIEQPKYDHYHTHNVNVHNSKIRSVTLRLNRAIERSKIDMFMQLLLSAHHHKILRVKGLVWVENQPRPLLIQAVGSLLSEPVFLDQWPTENYETFLVVFLNDMEEEFLRRLFAGFMDEPLIDTADAAALTENPLAISGIKLKPSSFDN